MLKLNVGFNRKSGEANYGSRGASVNLELELDSGLAADPERLKERIRFLFGLAKASVEEGALRSAHQWPRGDAGRYQRRMATAEMPPAGPPPARYGHCTRLPTVRPSTCQICSATVSASSQPEDLSITEASELIDSLKNSTNGAGGRR